MQIKVEWRKPHHNGSIIETIDDVATVDFSPRWVTVVKESGKLIIYRARHVLKIEEDIGDLM